MTRTFINSGYRMSSTGRIRRLLVGSTLLLGACQSDHPLAPSGALPERLYASVAATSMLTSLGDSAVVRARVVDAAGNEITGTPLAWNVSDPDVLESLGGGVFRSRANGTTVVRVTVDPSATGARPSGYFADRLIDSVVVTVQQQPARIIAVSADTAFTLLGQSRSMAVRITDARGHQLLAGFAPSWYTSDRAVAVVDSTGRVRTLGNGTTQLTVRAGSAELRTTLIVNAVRTHVSCMRYLNRRQQQQQCVTNTVTMWAAGGRTP
jgi:hypothetical protein